MPNLQGGSSSFLQGGGSSSSFRLQPANTSMKLQPASTNGIKLLQPAVGNIQGTGAANYSLGGAGGKSVAASPNIDFAASTAASQAAAAAAAAQAENDAKAGKLRGDITGLVNSIKDIFNARYGQVDAAAGDQVSRLNDRFKNESGDIATQVTGENEKLGAAHAAGGTYDSSYRGNNVDTVTHAGEGQIRDLGDELQENVGKVGAWATQQKSGFDANKQGVDQVLARLNESNDPAELTSIRNSLDSRIAELKGGNADNNTMAQNTQALQTIAPTSARAQSLKTTLSQIVAGNADVGQKQAIGQRLISAAGLTPEEQQALMMGFSQDLNTQDKQRTA